MATRWAVASGNWSSTATWNGGTLPAVDDDVFADGWQVTVNQSITVLSLNSTQRSGGNNGGSFTAATGGLTINCQTINTGSALCLRLAGASVITLTVNVDTVNASLTNNLVYGIDHQNSLATLIVNARIINGGGGASSTSYGVRNQLGGTLIVNCTEAIGGSGTTGAAIANVSTGSLTVNGNVRGGSGSFAVGVTNTSSGSVLLNGNSTAGSNATAYGIRQSSNGSVVLNGIAIASDTAEAIDNASTGTFTIAAACHAPNGRAPWTGNGRIFFSNLDLAYVTVNNSAHVSRMLGRRLLAPLGSFEGGLHG